ncbi:MAG: twin-arginine translocase TatA/TatE family subunit [Bdellovibrionales bacterium]
MFNFGFTELIVLGAIALLVIGPQQLPQVAKSLAKLLKEFRNISADITSSLADAKHSVRSQVDDVKKEVQEAADFEKRLLDLINEKAKAAEGTVSQGTPPTPEQIQHQETQETQHAQAHSVNDENGESNDEISEPPQAAERKPDE